MAINPQLITTIRVDQLPDGTLNLTNKIPHSNGTVLEKASVQDLVDLVATAVGVSGGVGYIALSVTDGQQLPDVPELPSFFLCGAGTFLNINGYPNIICTENLNAIMSLTDHWELAVEIPINPLSGTVQSVTGSAVDNTDPLNPIVNLSASTLQAILDNNHDLVDGINFQGTGAGTGNSGTSINGFGLDAGYNNSGNEINAFGTSAGFENSGNFINAFGGGAALQNLGYFINAVGSSAASYNEGNYVNAFGTNAGFENTSDNLNAFGSNAGQANTAENVNAFGSNAGLDNIWNNVNLFGESATADANNQNVFSKFIDVTTRFFARLSFNNITDDRKWELPDQDGTIALTSDIPAAGVTSVGLTMPSAFSVTNSPITSSGDIDVTAAGLVSQYVRGDGTLANFPTSTGGGSSVNYYLNGSVSQGTFGGTTYYQMSKTPILGAGTNFTRTNGAGNGYIASFITDAGDPSFLNIPGGNWNLEFYFQSSATGGSPQFYGEIYKVSATNVFTLVASGSANPESITNGTTIDQYFTSISVPQTSLLITDRLAVRIYVITSGRTITLHTENGNLCEVLTTFTTGLTALNGLTQQVQNLAVGTSGTDFAISSATDTHTFNLPTASASNRGALSSTDWSTFNSKQNASTRRNANNTSNNNINYCGVALGTGVSESSAVWTITRLTIAASGSITTATATNVAWTNRQSATYI